MKKDEIIELLKEQLRVANDTVSSLTTWEFSINASGDSCCPFDG